MQSNWTPDENVERFDPPCTRAAVPFAVILRSTAASLKKLDLKPLALLA
jgi:hypothetical protein